MGGTWRPLQPKVTTCRSCGGRIFFARSITTGRNVCINAEADPEGNIILTVERSEAQVLGPDAAAAWQGRKWTSHHATCPSAGQWRRRQGGSGR